MKKQERVEKTDGKPTLDGLLTQWAQAQRLSEAQSAGIRQSLRQSIPMQRIPAAQTELPYLWWWRLFQQCTRPMALLPRREGAR